jgi:hemoglobin-like flavoprotein
MTETTVATLRESFAWVANARAELVSLSFARFFDRSPELKILFAPDLATHEALLDDSLRLIFDGLHDWPRTMSELERVGKRYSHLGVRPGYFELINSSLLVALSDMLGDRYTAPVDLAWRSLLSTVNRVMSDSMEFGSWTVPGIDLGNPFAPIMGVTVQRYAQIVSQLDSIDDQAISVSTLASFGLDRQEWEIVRSGWNARITDPTVGGVVAVAYIDAAKTCAVDQR